MIYINTFIAMYVMGFGMVVPVDLFHGIER